MTIKIFRARLATVCVATMLVPVGAVLAEARIEQEFELCQPALRRAIATPPVTATSPWEPAALLIPINAAPPWFRKTFYLFGTDRTCPRAPLAALAASATQRPGAVKSLRRTDRR